MKPVFDVPSVCNEALTAKAQTVAGTAIWAWLFAGVMLAIVFIAGNFPLVSGKQAGIWDAECFFAPAFTLIADHARAGKIVLWNPWQSGGSPDYAEPELGNLSPVAVFMGALAGGTDAGFRAYWLAFWFCGGLGMLVLARQLRALPWMGWVAAVAFMFCGFYTSHAEHTSSIYSFSFLPWIVWRLDVAVTTRGRMAAAQAGALWGLSGLGGYPQLTILSGGFAFLWAVGRWYFSASELDALPAERIASGLRFKIQVFVLFFAVGVAILAPSYVSFFLEGGAGYSDRVGPRSRQESISSNLIEPGALTTFSSPYLTDLKFFNPRLWPHSDTSLTNIYMGGLITVFALLSTISKPRSKWRWWLLGVAMFFLGCSVGRYLPLRGWLYDYCIPTRYFRNPALFRAYTMFLASVLALLTMMDLDEKRQNPQRNIWVKLAFVSGVSAIAAYAAYTHTTHAVKNLGPWLHRANNHLAWAWLGSFAISLLLLFVPKSRKLLPWFIVIFAVTDAGQTIRLARMTVSSGGPARHKWARINADHNRSLLLTGNGLQRDLRPPAWIGTAKNNDNVPMKIATFLNDATMTNTFHILIGQDPVLADMATGKDRIWFSPVVAVAAPKDIVYSALATRSNSLGAPVLVVHAPEQMREIKTRTNATSEDVQAARTVDQLPAAQNVPFKLLRYTPNHLDFDVTVPTDGWILVTDRWCRGWRVKVNGQSSKNFGGDFIFRAVKVHGGNNLINFEYRPAGWPVLFFLSWGTLAGVLLGPQFSPTRLRNRVAETRIVVNRGRQVVGMGARRCREALRLSQGVVEDQDFGGWIVGGAIVVLVFVAGNFKLISGVEALPWDASGFFAPAFTLVADHARAGRIMLWNPWVAGGSPDYAEPELGAISPVAILVGSAIGGTETGFRIYYLLIWLLGPIGLLVLARHFRAPPWAGAVVALGMLYCGFYTGHAQHTSSVYSFSWLPLIVWRMDVALAERRLWPALQAGALWGLSALGGYPQLVILTGGLILIWAIGRLLWNSSAEPPDVLPGSTRSHKIGFRLSFFATTFLAFVSVGVAVFAAPYAAFFVEGHGFADRVGTRPRQEAIESMRLPVGAVSTFASPYLSKLKYFNHGNPWPETDGTMVSIYSGALIPTFALLALIWQPRSAYRWWLGGVMIFFLCFAVGNQLPLRGWLYDYIYPTRYFRNAALFRQYAIFCAAVLALLCCKDLEEVILGTSNRLWTRFLIGATSISIGAFAAYAIVLDRSPNHGDLVLRANSHFVLVWLAGPAIGMLALLHRKSRKFVPVLVVIVACADALGTISIIQGGVFQFVSSSGAARASWDQLNLMHNPDLDLRQNSLNRIVRMADGTPHLVNKNVLLKVATFENYETMSNRFELDFWFHPTQLEMSTGPDRLWFSSDAVEVTPTDELYAVFLQKTESLHGPILMVHPPGEMAKIRERNLTTPEATEVITHIRELPPAQKIAAKLIRYTPNHLDLEVTCPGEGWLLITDRWASGWRVRVNGRAEDLFGGDFIFRAVRVREGANRVEFSYRPFGFPALFILSWTTLAVIFLGPYIKPAWNKIETQIQAMPQENNTNS